MTIGNVKGALSMAAVLALPAGIPDRERLIAIVFGVTLVTLVTQALPFGRLLRWLKVGGAAADEVLDQSKAVLIDARRAQSELDGLLASGLISRREHAQRWAEFQRDIIGAERVLHVHQKDTAHDQVAEHAILSARKAAILDAARRGLISQQAAGTRVAALDEQFLRSKDKEH
jgi:CPA1 family monovalent cation:H+ antiporter